ncbi:bifunctional DNA primase/polymerase [Rhodococcus pyridinivorans]|uniref:Bifunctional DNA primase/polymerase n=1 Tax=Rhodococcus pyridinivorans TaxID=103816 RepID=A0A7M2XS22_9NOCA|nr:bifunctional DNA primase/polymerase [Rhodococcus pyridinivorans]QOV99711.1 bifunctional DNA primase/polymerase [Rhodococcus pyridinivorans]
MMDTSYNDMDAALAGLSAASDGPTFAQVKALARAGFHVLLIKPGTKEPVDLRTDRERAHDARTGRGGSGLYSSTNRVDRLENLWDRAVAKFGQEPNVAVDVERSGLVVIDADQADETADVQRRGLAGADAPLEAYAPTVTTPGAQDAAGKWVHSGGGHFHFAVDVEDLPLVKSFKLPGGAEVSTKDRYVLIPPSVRNEGPYTVTGHVRPLSSAPWLIDLIRAQAETDEADTTARAQAAQDRTQRRESEGPSSVEAWNDAHPWEELLLEHDWTPTGKPDNCGCPIVTAPGDHASPKSATAHEDGCTNRRVDLEGASGPLHIWTDHPPVELEGRERWTKAQFVAAMRGQTMEEFLVAEGLVDDEVDPAAMAFAVNGEAGGKGPVVRDLTVDEEEAFWASSAALERVRQFAWSRSASPWSVLGVVLCEVVARVPPHVVLPPIVGGAASLNLFVNLVGASGEGKGKSVATAEDLTSGLSYAAHKGIGSGEGITKTFGVRKKGSQVTLRVRDRAVVDSPEVDTLTAVAERKASTILGQLRKAWSGEDLSFNNADESRSPEVPKHSYRLALHVGVQPGRARALFEDADGGTPQRFLWLSTLDPLIPDADVPEPPPLDLAHIEKRWPTDPFLTGEALLFADDEEEEESTPRRDDGVLRKPTTFEVLEVAQPIRDTIRRNDKAKHWRKATDSALDGHRGLQRLKVAAALSLLEGGTGNVTVDHWDRAELVLRRSDAVRAQVQGVLQDQDRKAAEARAKRNAEAEVAKDRATQGLKLAQTRKRVHKVLGKPEHADGLPLGKLRAEVGSAYRDHINETVDFLVEAGELVEVPGGKAPKYRLVGTA